MDFWWYTPAETAGMLNIANEKLKYETVQHAQILMWIANAPHAQRKDKKLFELNDFLPSFAKHEQSAEEVFDMWWNEAE